MKEIRQITCIRCPMGCLLTVELIDGVVTKVSGNQCKRGEEYAKTECVNPVRTLTTTVKVINGRPLPVRSAEPLPKALLFPCLSVLRGVTVTAPVEIGTVIVPNICGTGIDIVATTSFGMN